MNVKELLKAVKEGNNKYELNYKGIDKMRKDDLMEIHYEIVELDEIEAIEEMEQGIEDNKTIKTITNQYDGTTEAVNTEHYELAEDGIIEISLLDQLKAKDSVEVKNNNPKEMITKNVQKYTNKKFRVSVDGIFVDVTIRKCGTIKAENAFIIKDEKRIIFRVKDFKFVRLVKKEATEVLKEVL